MAHIEIDKAFKIHKAVSVDETRYTLTHVKVDGDWAVASDGRILAAVPVVNEGGATGLFPPHAFEDGGKAGKQHLVAIEDEGATVSFATKKGKAIAPKGEGDFPDFKQVLPTPGDDDVTVAIDPRLLLALAEAMGDATRIVLRIKPNNGAAPMMAASGTCNGAFGLIMPVVGAKREVTIPHAFQRGG